VFTDCLRDLGSLTSLPFVFHEHGHYCLFYERLLTVMPMHTRVEAITSPDLFTWSRPVTVFKPSLAWHRAGSWHGTVGNPCVVAASDGYRLYYSAGLTFLKDCKFYEPKYIGMAHSRSLLGTYEPQLQPLLTPSADDPYANLGAGAMKVVKTEDGYIGFQNGIYWDETCNHSRSAIRLLASVDGIHWSPLQQDPIVRPGEGWKLSHVYALDVRQVEGVWVMYFNARDGWLLGRERIGRAVEAPVSDALCTEAGLGRRQPNSLIIEGYPQAVT